MLCSKVFVSVVGARECYEHHITLLCQLSYPHELEECENTGALIITSPFDISHVCDDNTVALSSNYS